ncbi:MAG: acyl-CoA dehydratase activase [Clostridiales bacterium]
MDYFAGLDAGSTYLKAALIDSNMKILGLKVMNTGIKNSENAEILLRGISQKLKINRNNIKFIMATGYSRKGLETADDDISEITAHAYGVRINSPKGSNPTLIIDIGGQDSKVIYLDEKQNVKNFAMNDKCAAGTGKFMEVIAEVLETTIDKVGPISLESNAPSDINSTCIVFAQSEVISLVARKTDRRDILAGIHVSMARRIVKMTRKASSKGDILMTGGGALNIGLKSAFEEELMRPIHVAKYPQFNGSIGAAILGLKRYRKDGI